MLLTRRHRPFRRAFRIGTHCKISADGLTRMREGDYEQLIPPPACPRSARVRRKPTNSPAPSIASARTTAACCAGSYRCRTTSVQIWRASFTTNSGRCCSGSAPTRWRCWSRSRPAKAELRVRRRGHSAVGRNVAAGEPPHPRPAAAALHPGARPGEQHPDAAAERKAQAPDLKLTSQINADTERGRRLAVADSLSADPGGGDKRASPRQGEFDERPRRYQRPRSDRRNIRRWHRLSARTGWSAAGLTGMLERVRALSGTLAIAARGRPHPCPLPASGGRFRPQRRPEARRAGRSAGLIRNAAQLALAPRRLLRRQAQAVCWIWPSREKANAMRDRLAFVAQIVEHDAIGGRRDFLQPECGGHDRIEARPPLGPRARRGLRGPRPRRTGIRAWRHRHRGRAAPQGRDSGTRPASRPPAQSDRNHQPNPSIPSTCTCPTP